MRSKPPSKPGAGGASQGPRRAAPRDRTSGPRPSRPPEPGQAPRGGRGPRAEAARADAAKPDATRPDAARLDAARPGVARGEGPKGEARTRPEAPRGPGHDGIPAPRRETLRVPSVPAAGLQAGNVQAGASEAGAQKRASGAAAPRGSLWLHGTHAVAAALVNPARRLKRLLLTEDAEAALLARVPQPWPIPVERVDRARLDHLLGRDTVHQGVGLLADLLSPPSLAAVLARPGPLLILDQVTDPRNIGATLRSAAAFGAAGVVLQDRNAPEETGVMAKAASGALETVPLLRAVNLARTLVALKAAGLWVVGLDAGAPALRGTALAERRTALVLGAEGEGMRRLVRETCDELCGLAMPGTMESLNVSAAATLALYELTRQA